MFWYCLKRHTSVVNVAKFVLSFHQLKLMNISFPHKPWPMAEVSNITHPHTTSSVQPLPFMHSLEWEPQHLNTLRPRPLQTALVPFMSFQSTMKMFDICVSPLPVTWSSLSLSWLCTQLVCQLFSCLLHLFLCTSQSQIMTRLMCYEAMKPEYCWYQMDYVTFIPQGHLKTI